MNDIIAYMLGYVSLFIVSFFLMNFISNGFLGVFIRVRSSRGKKVLVIVYGMANTYPVAGRFIDGALSFKSQAKVKKLISNVPQEAIVRWLGVASVSVDELTDGVLLKDFDGVSGHDASKVDSLITRALMLPKKAKDNVLMVIILLLLIIVVGLVIFDTVKITELTKLVGALKVQGVII